MKIRKVDDKPMVIHTKEKAKIHAHEPKGAKIKGSNIYTVERGPKTAGAKVTDTDRKKSYRKSTIHQSEPKNKGLSRFKRNLKESNTSIKTKNTNLHIAGRTGALAAGAVTEQVEGGHEVSQAAYLAYEASRPVTGTASKGAALFRKKAAAEAKKRIKKVEAGKKLAKKTATVRCPLSPAAREKSERTLFRLTLWKASSLCRLSSFTALPFLLRFGLLPRTKSKKAKPCLLTPARWGIWLTVSTEILLMRIFKSLQIHLRHSKKVRLKMSKASVLPATFRKSKSRTSF
ncbi:Uncharacterised protein [uncultured Dorea sp.]|nr:Uncharacterised protein [uncultured Dorea sp.]